MQYELHNANCLDILRGLQSEIADAVVTDPPYGIGYVSTKGKKVLNDERPFIWWLHDAFRVTKPGGSLVCFCRWDVQEAFRFAIELAGYRVKSQVIWDRGVHGIGDTKSTFAPQHDVVWFAAKGKFQFPGKRPKSVIKVQKILSGWLHPTQKPVDLMQQLVEAVTPEGGLVIDPFMGSGSTGDACIACGRSFLGIEADPEHFQTAEQRLQLSRGSRP